MKKPLFFFALLLPLCFAFTTPQNDRSDDGCRAPLHPTLTSQYGGSATFEWDDCSCGGNYHVYYTKNGQTSAEYVTGNAEITVNGLTTGTYQFHFYTECGTEVSSIIVVEIII